MGAQFAGPTTAYSLIKEQNLISYLYDLLLILHTSTINVEFYSLSNTFYFIILCYIEQKIYLFLWSPAISSFKCQKKSGQQGNTRHLKVRTLKVKIGCVGGGITIKKSLMFNYAILIFNNFFIQTYQHNTKK